MKSFVAAVLIGCLLLSLSGCSLLSGEIQEPVTFYYQCADYLQQGDDQAIASEERDGTGHITDPEFLLRLYLIGPNDEELISPFPPDLQIINVRLGTDTIIVTLSNHLDSLSSVQRSIACACLALTSMEVSGMGSVTLTWEDVLMTLNPESITLYDSSVPNPQ